MAAPRRVGTWVSWERPPILSRIFQQLDRLVRSREAGSGPLRAGSKRALVLFLLLFALAVPHSIAVSQAAFLLALTIAIIRRLTGQQDWRVGRTEPSIEWPLGGFLVLTILSSVFSAAPAISLVKLKTIGLFLIIFLVRGELSRRGGQIVVGCLVVSSLVGVGYSWLEKGLGRGVIVTSVKTESPWWKAGLRPGDLIWMIDRKRVRSVAEIGRELAAREVGESVSVEALHAGDPLPIELRVTQQMREDVGRLGIAGSRAGRQFRVSGFSRQFLTYAEQMQLLALLVLGWGLVGKRRGAAILLFLVFTGTLLLTATRSVTLSLVLAIALMAWWSGGRRGLLAGLLAAGLLGALGLYIIGTSRQSLVARFSDDSTLRRIGYMRAGLRMIPRHPVLGVGMDAHRVFWKEWGFPGDYITHTHSTPIQIALDRGVPALGCLVWFFVAVWRDLVRRYRLARARQDLWAAGLGAGVLAATVGFGLSALTNYNFGDSETLMLWLLLLGVGQSTMEENVPWQTS